jgi:hypothetical protein
MLIKEDNKDIQALISDIDKSASIIRKGKMLIEYPEIEREFVELYQNLVLPFIEQYIETGLEIESYDEEILRNELLLFLNDLLIVIKAGKE